MDASEDLPFDIFLASLERETNEEDCEDDYYDHHRGYRKYDYYDDEDEDEDEDDYDGEIRGGGNHDVYSVSYVIKVLSDMESNVVVKNPHLDNVALLDVKCFEGMDPDDNEQGYRGNEVCLWTGLMTLYADFQLVGQLISILVPCHGKPCKCSPCGRKPSCTRHD